MTIKLDYDKNEQYIGSSNDKKYQYDQLRSIRFLQNYYSSVNEIDNDEETKTKSEKSNIILDNTINSFKINLAEVDSDEILNPLNCLFNEIENDNKPNIENDDQSVFNIKSLESSSYNIDDNDSFLNEYEYEL